MKATRLLQVSVNDVVMVFAFAPIVAFLLGVTDIAVPWETLVPVRRPVRGTAAGGGSLDPDAASAARTRIEAFQGTRQALVGHRADRDGGDPLWSAGSGHSRPAAGHRADRGADPDPVLRHLCLGLCGRLCPARCRTGLRRPAL